MTLEIIETNKEKLFYRVSALKQMEEKCQHQLFFHIAFKFYILTTSMGCVAAWWTIFSYRLLLRGLSCKIKHCDDIEWIVNVPSVRNTTTDSDCICFHSLTVRYLQNLVGVCKGKIASHTFSGLTELCFNHCNRMKKLFPRAILQDLKNLQVLWVQCCDEMEEIIGREEEGSSQSSNSQITSTTTDLPKLKQLHLSVLPELKRICEGKLICDSLESMEFKWCPNLKKLPFCTPNTNAHPLPSLKRIEVKKNWWERLEWDQSHVKTLLQPYLIADDDEKLEGNQYHVKNNFPPYLIADDVDVIVDDDDDEDDGGGAADDD